MSIKRRQELLQWASKNNTFIIEDDYDHEFSNWEKPVSSIYSLDKQERVIYLGTFNKLMHPSIRLGYIIAPNYLLDTITALYEQSTRFVSPSLQKTLSSFIEKDYLNKHLRRVFEVSVERKKIFIDCFKSNFGDEIYFDKKNTGLHIIGYLKENINDLKLSNHLATKNIIAYPLSQYFINEKKETGLVLGYCSVNNKLIKENIVKMNNAYLDFCKFK